MRTRIEASLFVTLLTAALVGGCGDGGGDDIVGECASNLDCALPMAICDPVAGRCVECLDRLDCPAGQLCNAGMCECSADGGCGSSACTSDDDCGTEAPVCDPASGQCRGCVSNADCPFPTAVCETATGACVECLGIADCAHSPGTVCSLGECVCAEGGTSCGAAGCVDLQSDPANCGACGFECFDGCTAGSCDGSWVPVDAEGAPSARCRMAAAWTGSELLVWGGSTDSGTLGEHFGDGGRYDPVTQSWRPMAVVDAPSPRADATAVWTGSRMIVWGGRSGSTALGDGGIYDPSTDRWTPIPVGSGSPSRRYQHVAVWTGDAMIVHGGFSGNELANGALFDPETGEWTPLPATPESRREHSAVWDGSDMVIYGGYGDAGTLINTDFPTATTPGGRAIEPAGSWTALATVGQPAERRAHTAVWAGDAMVVFGGRVDITFLSDGGVYADGSWTAMAEGPLRRSEHTAVWLEGPQRMVVWGGWNNIGFLDNGASYDPEANEWSESLPRVLSARVLHAAVSTGDAMIVWGGFGSDGAPLGDGAVYTP